jgi:plasmid stabilization system protein ParE
MAEIIWSRSAIQDLKRLYQFLAKANLNAASQAVFVIQASVQRLGNFPESGRPVNGMDIE